MKRISILFFALIIISFTSCDSSSSKYDAATYQIKLSEIKTMEHSEPTVFLSADGNYNQNFWGDKLKVHCIIKNKALLAAFKDITVRVTFYTKTKTVLGSNDYKVYELVPPSSEKQVELEIENYKDVDAIGWDVVDAVSTEI